LRSGQSSGPIFDANDMEQLDAGCKYFLLPKWSKKLRLFT
jgi:hypothetical protein